MTGTIADYNNDAFFVQIDNQTYKLPKHEIVTEEILDRGSVVKGFVYENKHGDLIMTQFYPNAQIDQYGFGKVVETRRDLGVFVDVGLPDKDMVVSLDDLPLDRSKWPKSGDQLLVALQRDHKNRLWAVRADENIFEQLSVKFPNNLVNKELNITIYASKFDGAFGISDEYYLTFVHNSQIYQPLRVGEQIKARVIGISQYGRLNMSLLPQSYEVIDEDAQMILMMLKRKADHALPFADTSSPEDIKANFGISKSGFKRAVGSLLKAKLITQDKQKPEIRLTDEQE